MQKKVLVFGYYFQKNFGDDMFKHVIENVLINNHNVTFKNLEEIKHMDTIIKNTSPDVIIFGCGDIINEYYFNKSQLDILGQLLKKIPVIYLGIGLSYPNLINLLDIGDYFFLRNKIDYNSCVSRFSNERTFYTPDLAFFLHNNILPKSKTKISKIAVCFPNTWFKQHNSLFFNKLVNIINKLSKSFYIYFAPFDTSNNLSNSDIILNNKFKNIFKDNPSIFFPEPNTTHSGMISFFESMDIILSSRFHSLVYSILTNTPFISIFNSRKVDCLKEELPEELQKLFLTPDNDHKNIPLELNELDFFKSLDYLVTNYNKLTNTIHTVKLKYFKQSNSVKETLDQILNTPSIRTTPPFYLTTSNKSFLINKVYKTILDYFGRFSIKNMEELRSNKTINSILKNRRPLPSSIESELAEEILYTITEDPYGPYLYGLKENLLSSPLNDRISWIIDDYYTRFKYSTFTTSSTIINKNFQEVHRSGWQYIINHILVELEDDIGNVIIDTYTDKTFHWNSDFYSKKKVIPYTSKWVGFIHHTFSNYNNEYNCIELFNKKLFLQSLKCCSGLIVMSRYLKQQVENILKEKGFENVPVFYICHPSEPSVVMFSYDAFRKNKERKIIQIGNWLRDMFAIYKLSIPNKNVIHQKCVLKNKNTDNYFLPDGFFNQLFSKMSLTDSEISNNMDMCRISFENMHLKGMYFHIMELQNSVDIIEHLSNSDYDKLLSCNIVFIKLIDASAVNTIIECILRNTPILVNPLPAVVELLGKDYPFYYKSFFEASELLNDFNTIQAAHLYLQNMNKDSFAISSFISSFKTILKSI